MNQAALDLSAELAEELAANDVPVVDPRTVPIRFSALKAMAVSPLHYWWACQNQREETLSMRLGSGAHALLFGTEYHVWDGKVRSGKAWEAFRAEHAGRLILSRSELAKARAMADAIKAHRLAADLLFADDMVHERRIEWEWGGRSCRSTPDANSRRVLVDLKCLKSADPEQVKWQAARSHYHGQCAFYRRALNETGHQIEACYLVVVENKPPHPVTVLRYSDAALEAGDRNCALWLELVRVYEERNEWPGYVQGVVDLDLPDAGPDLVFGDEGDSNTEGQD